MNYLITSLLYDLGGSIQYEGHPVSAIDITYCQETTPMGGESPRIIGAELYDDGAEQFNRVLYGSQAEEFVKTINKPESKVEVAPTPAIVTVVFGDDTMKRIYSLLSKGQIIPNDLFDHEYLTTNNIKELTPIG